MANAKVTLNGVTLIDLTSDTVTASDILQGKVAHGSDGSTITGTYVPTTVSLTTGSANPTESSQHIIPPNGYDGFEYFDVGAISSNYVGSNIPTRTSTNLTASGSYINVPAGYYATAASKAVSVGTTGTPIATKGTVSNHSISITPSVTNSTGYITGGTKTGTAVTVQVSELVSGTKTISANGTGIDVTNYASVDVAVPGETPVLETILKNYTPTTSVQSEVITAGTGYDAIGEVDILVAAIPSQYIVTTDATATASDILYNKTAYAKGSKITGTYTPPTPSLQSKSVSYSPSETAESETITPSSGYDGLSQVSVSVGAISSSYVGSGVPRIGTRIYRPITTDQTISPGQYIDGVQTILGDANLVPENIKKDVAIFAIRGTYEGQSYPSATGVNF